MIEITETESRQQQQQQDFDIFSNVAPQGAFDDDGRLQRTGTVWTASAHILTTVMGTGVLSLTWAIAQLGWIAGPTMMILFSFVACYTSTLLAACYRSEDPVAGRRNYTYMDAVRANLGAFQTKLCGATQYLNLAGVAIGYSIGSSRSMMTMQRANCFHSKGVNSPCIFSIIPYSIAFGAVEIVFSQIPNFDQLCWLSIFSAIMSSIYSTIVIGLGAAKIAEAGEFRGSLTGIRIGTITGAQKTFQSFQAIGSIAFAYGYSLILIEIQDTMKSPPSEYKTMKKATFVSLSVTTIFYMLCGCIGYAAFGDVSPGNLLTGFGFYNPYWLLDIANAAIVFHHIGAYQVCCQPIFAFVEKTASEWFPNSKFITHEIPIPIPFSKKTYNLNLFRLVWRSIFVIITTIISMFMPFFNAAVGVLGAIGLWRLTVSFPVAMYIVQKKIHKWSKTWICLKILSISCLVISIAAAVGSFAGLVSVVRKGKLASQH